MGKRIDRQSTDRARHSTDARNRRDNGDVSVIRAYRHDVAANATEISHLVRFGGSGASVIRIGMTAYDSAESQRTSMIGIRRKKSMKVTMNLEGLGYGE